MTLRAVLWDMDGTLLDSEPASARALAAAMGEVGIDPDPAFVESVIGISSSAVYERLRGEFALAKPYDEWVAIMLDRLVALLADVPEFPASLAVWRTLHERGVAQAVVSNSDRVLVDVNLGRLGLTRPGLITVSRNDVVRGKPAAEPYLRAAHLLGVAPSEVVVVEDSAPGLQAGMAAGMRSVVIPWAHADVGDAAQRLATMDDLAALF